MGLTNRSTGIGAASCGLAELQKGNAPTIALAGNPNVGKSTVFNGLTGMNQHTGNWPGKTVTIAVGTCRMGESVCRLVDIPGTYSLMAHSAEEEVARNFLCFGEIDAVIVVCDATCLLRNLNLVLQVLEITPRAVVCVNLMDEARRKQLAIDLPLLERRLGVPVVGTEAQKKKSLPALLCAVKRVLEEEPPKDVAHAEYPEAIEREIVRLVPYLCKKQLGDIPARWLAHKLLEGDPSLRREIVARYPGELDSPELWRAVADARARLAAEEIDGETIRDLTVNALLERAEAVAEGVVTCRKKRHDSIDRRLDRVLTGRIAAYPVMLLLLCLVFWLTIVGANYPSDLLSRGLSALGGWLGRFFGAIRAPVWLSSLLVDGVYRVLASVVSVMLPPMAVFFPLFTLLEDSGYLPRIAYNLDRGFRRCRACGKQALTMCMGFGCNAAGVVGCRIIDSPRERLLAVLTNAFVPCNGKFPTLILLITVFFIGASSGLLSSLAAAAILLLLILLGVLATFLVTRLLSATLLRGVPSSFTLELPPYRRPQLGRVIIRSVLDRTLFVLGRAVAVAAPAGLLLWLLSNLSVNGISLLSHGAAFLDPFARLLGLDGVILIAFILALPANEIVLPIVLMAYMAEGSLPDLPTADTVLALLTENGWTSVTAVCFLLFSLFHWPCSTTLITVRRETGRSRYMIAAALLPTAVGILLCFTVRLVATALGL